MSQRYAGLGPIEVLRWPPERIAGRNESWKMQLQKKRARRAHNADAQAVVDMKCRGKKKKEKVGNEGTDEDASENGEGDENGNDEW